MPVLRDYQEAAVAALLGSKRGLLVAGAGSGKTLTACAAIDRWLGTQTGKRVLWLSPTTELCEQAVGAARNFDLPSRCEFVSKCYQAGELASGYDLVVADEAHVATAPTFRQLFTGYAGPLFGLTATPGRDDDAFDDLTSLIGPVLYTVDRSELLGDGHLAPAEVTFLCPNARDEFAEIVEADTDVRFEKMRYAIPHTMRQVASQSIDSLGRMLGGSTMQEAIILAERHGVASEAPLRTLVSRDPQARAWVQKAAEATLRSRAKWQSVLKHAIYENEKRNDAIVEAALAQQGRSTLVLVATQLHGKALAARIPGAVLMHSKMKKREEMVEKFRRGEITCACSTSMLEVGFDAPIAEVLIMTVAGRSTIRMIQSSGRVLRPFPGKTSGKVIDFWDVQAPMLLAQSKARAKTFASMQGYEFVGATEILPTVLGAVGITLHPALPGGMLPRKKSTQKENEKCVKKEVASTSGSPKVPSTSPILSMNNTTNAEQHLPAPQPTQLALAAPAAAESVAPAAAPPAAGSDLAHTERAHARFSPSSLKAKAICPGFQNDPSGDPKYALRGTLGHEAVEHETPEICFILDAAGNKTDVVDTQLKEAVEACIAYTRGVTKGKQVHREMRLHYLDQFGHVDLVAISGASAALVDYKFSFNFHPAAGPQFQAYCLGVWNHWPQVEAITVHTVHPFLGKADVETYTRSEHYSAFTIEVKAIIARASLRRPEDFTLSDQCRFCGASGLCPKLAELGAEIGRRYAPELQIPQDITFHGSEVSDPDAVAQLLQLAPIVTKAASGWNKRGMELHDQGVDVPGYEVARRSGKRSVASANVAFDVVRQFAPQITIPEFMEHCSVTATGLDELVKAASPKGKKAKNVEMLAHALEDADALQYGAESRYLRKVR